MTICVSHEQPVGPSHERPDMVRLATEPQSVAAGRRWVSLRLRALGVVEEVVEVAELLTSELMTNAVKYGAASGEMTVTAHRYDEVLDIAVADDGPQVPVLRASRPGDLGGRGLLLVEELASQWGIELRHDTGKSVWFHLPAQPALA